MANSEERIFHHNLKWGPQFEQLCCDLEERLGTEDRSVLFCIAINALALWRDQLEEKIHLVTMDDDYRVVSLITPEKCREEAIQEPFTVRSVIDCTNDLDFLLRILESFFSLPAPKCAVYFGVEFLGQLYRAYDSRFSLVYVDENATLIDFVEMSPGE